MEAIEMVDLKKQYQKIKPAVDKALQECIDAASFIRGPQVTTFENQLASYLGVKNVISCANGTDALQLAMMALDVKAGDEVIVPAFTYVAAVEVIALLGLSPVIVDVDPRTFMLNRALVEEALSPRTRLVVPVHLFGQCADMQGILDLCRAYSISVLEDTAQAIGAWYTFSQGEKAAAGTMGNLGTTSFFPSKNLGCFGDGGAVYTHDDRLAARVKMMANHGQARKYFHETVGINSRLDTLQAAILLEKLKKLDEYQRARQEVAARYDQAFGPIEELEIPYRSPASTHVFNQYTLKVPLGQREGLREFLSRKKIPSMIYYPQPLHRQPAYRSIGRVVGDLAVTEDLCQRVISLPMHTELSNVQIEYICESILDYFRKLK
ncbi:DegT/DnrJ/EryC1/StrS family aminotransferase [Rhabdobacter roseus]|uniref:dTDP-4-amino-4,6-dideoxygalactose transaminase n=1 Tax=Rhabdobacter roseus TaxID=1655419 RepID=A0A840TIT3_9BACT|nr:DegT/DnrJ/EryC1/StrS family aminotransferase [Rhabdobacter roseus]MBB5283271.1 dTDP-4-amino-4,6-dideoxygalactose transaminase [Rhabdobacter roseus]